MVSCKALENGGGGGDAWGCMGPPNYIISALDHAKKPGCDFPWLGGTAALSSLDIKLHLLKTSEIFQTLSSISKHDSDALGNPKWGATCEAICYLWKY